MTVTKNFNNLDTDNTLGGNSPSDYRVSSQKAIKEYVDNSSVDTTQLSYYGTSDSAATDIEKVVLIPEITELKVGQTIIVQPSITSTVANSTLKLNNFDAYPMRYAGSAITTTTDSHVWSANFPTTWLFDGTYWVFLAHGTDVNSTYTINYSIDQGQYKVGVGTYAVSRYSLILQKPDGTWEKPTNTSANYSTAKSKTVNTSGFLLNEIKYNAAKAEKGNGGFLATNTIYSKVSSINFAYSSNCGTAPGWAVGDYIYLVGAMGSDGLFYLDSTKWWDNALPTANDGKLYIQLGIALTATDSTMSFFDHRPVFYHDGTKLCEYKVADNKQDTLVSGTNIKTINNQSLLGSGNITIESGSDITVDSNLSTTSENPVQNKVITTELNKKIEGISSSDVTTALGYTPYNSSNPNGYTSNVGTVTSVNNTQPDTNGNVELTIPSEVTESTVSGWGFTKNIGTVTKVNNISPVNGNVTLSIPTVPTNVSTFTNDVGYLTEHQDISGKQDVIDANHKLSADLLSEGTTNKLVSANEKATWSGKQDALTQTQLDNITAAGTALQPNDNISELNNDAGYLTAHQDISGKADKATTLSGYGITDAYTKTEIDGKLTGAMHYKGTVATVAALDNISTKEIGDVYNVTETGDNYAWDGTKWDKLSGVVDLSGYVPTSRKVNGKTLTGDITLNASDVSALPANTAIPSKTSDITNDSGFITANDIPTNLSAFIDDLGSNPVHTHNQYLTEHQDISGKQDIIDSTHKLSSDLVDDTNKTNKFVTSAEKTTWNNKQNAINDLANIRSGAELGATALQPNDNISELNNDANYITSSALPDTITLSYYGTCATAADTQAKVVDCEGFGLKEGVSIRVKFTNNQSYNGQPTLNVNSTGAKGIVTSGAIKATKYCWLSGEVVAFTYDGTNWIMEDAGIASTTYYGYTKLVTSATSTSTGTSLTPASLNNLVLNMIEPYPVYSTSATYAVGDRVRYSYDTWECTTAITTAEAWNANHWTALDPIQTQIDNIRKLVEFKKPTTSSPSWYNLYSDGYVEQGGEITVGNTTIGQVTFSKEFENNKYMPILTCITYTAGNIDGLCHITELTTTGMKIFDASGRTYRWECKGYVAT